MPSWGDCWVSQVCSPCLSAESTSLWVSRAYSLWPLGSPSGEEAVWGKHDPEPQTQNRPELLVMSNAPSSRPGMTWEAPKGRELTRTQETQTANHPHQKVSQRAANLGQPKEWGEGDLRVTGHQTKPHSPLLLPRGMPNWAREEGPSDHCSCCR